jgi:hypothetical protein
MLTILALELGERAEDVKLERASGRRRVDTLAQRDEGHARAPSTR